MIIKSPVCYDFSHWRTIRDFSALDPFPFLVVTKATESLAYVDSTFASYFTGMKANGIHRGAFHFFRKNADAKKQAEHFCNVIRPYVEVDDILVLDFEEGGETAAQLLAWVEAVDAQYPQNLIMFYSRRNLMDAITMTVAQREKMRQYPVWVAGYPLNPDLYNEVPNFYIPDPTRWGPVWLWQYTDRGIIKGVAEGAGDCNWVSPTLEAILGNSGELPQPPDGGAMKKYRVVWSNGVARRSAPTTSNSTTSLPPYPFDAVVDVLQDGIPDQTDPTNVNKRWVKFADGYFGASDYPDGSGPKVRMIDVTPTEPPPPAETPTIEIVYDPSEVTVVLKPQ